MDLWGAYKNIGLKTFGTQKIVLSTGPRWNASLEQVLDRSFTLDINQAHFQRYAEARRYILAENIIFDMFASIYNVNTRDALVIRMTTPLLPKELQQLQRYVAKFGRPNLEFRFIGMQNGEEVIYDNIDKLKKAVPTARLAEIDLFGAETRHVALDLKTGTPYSLLLLNRIYRPGELNTTVGRKEATENLVELSYV